MALEVTMHKVLSNVQVIQCLLNASFGCDIAEQGTGICRSGCALLQIRHQGTQLCLTGPHSSLEL